MLALVLGLVGVGCGRLPGLPGAGADSSVASDASQPLAQLATPNAGGSTAQPDQATPRPGTTPPVAAHYGTIAQTLPLVGKVAATEEVPLAFQEKLLVNAVLVKPGQVVDEGQVLITTDSGEMKGKLEGARAKLDADTNELSQAVDAAAAKQRAAAQLTATTQQAQADRVAAARTGLDVARAKLQKVQAGALPADLQAAENAVTAAQITQRKAEADQLKAAAGPDPALLRTAEQELANAQASVVRAQADLDKRPADVAAAQQRLQMAQGIAETARTKLQALQAPDQSVVDAAQLGVDTAQLGVQAAQARLDQLRAGPAVADVRAAQDAVSVAQTALERAQASANGDPGVDGTGDTLGNDLSVRQKVIDKDNADIAKLEERVAATQLVAPFAGTVVTVRVRVGDMVDASRPAASLAKPGSPIIRATVTPMDMDKVSVGQQVQVQVQGQGEGAGVVSGTVLKLTANDAGTARLADIGVEWPSEAPKLGTVVDLGMVLQQKDDALLVPKKAVHTVNSKTFVELVDGNTKRVLNVQLGIVSTTDAEIVSGLSQGQVVFVGP